MEFYSNISQTSTIKISIWGACKPADGVFYWSFSVSIVHSGVWVRKCGQALRLMIILRVDVMYLLLALRHKYEGMCKKKNLSLWFPYFFFPSLALIFSLVFFSFFLFSFCIYLCLQSQYYIMCIIPNFILHKLSYFTPWIDWAMITSCEHTVSLPLFLSFLFLMNSDNTLK